MLIVVCCLIDEGTRPVATLQDRLDDRSVGDVVWTPIFGDAAIVRINRNSGAEPTATAVLLRRAQKKGR